MWGIKEKLVMWPYLYLIPSAHATECHLTFLMKTNFVKKLSLRRVVVHIKKFAQRGTVLFISPRWRELCLQLLVRFIPCWIMAFSGLSSDSSSSKDGTTADKQTTSSSGTGSKILIICLILVGVVLLSFSLFKFWQKKKREEQYARLLKLFEQDDELELELGLRDWACVQIIAHLSLVEVRLLILCFLFPVQ